jgi:hypothetical protein
MSLRRNQTSPMSLNGLMGHISLLCLAVIAEGIVSNA